MTTLYLVACVGAKLDGTHPAQDLYTSDWFRKARAFVEASTCPWYILSAAHGLLHPAHCITRYDVTLNRLGIGERRLWAARVLAALLPLLNPHDRVIVLAGKRYYELLVDPMKAMGVTVEIPMAHLGIGQQLQWMKGQLSHESSC